MVGRSTGGTRTAPRRVPGSPTASASVAVEDYLKAIWASSEWTSTPVSVRTVADRLRMSRSAASDAIRRLMVQGLVEHTSYGPIELTATGRATAQLVVRRHRVVVTYLVRELGYPLTEAHADADILEHASSDRLFKRMETSLARSGDTGAVGSDNKMAGRPAAMPLPAVSAGQRTTVSWVSAIDTGIADRIAALGLELDSEVEVAKSAGDTRQKLAIRAAGIAHPVELAPEEAAAIWVVPE